MGPAEWCTCLWLSLNILRNRASQKTSSNLSRAKSLTWKSTNHRTVFNLLIFAAGKKGSLQRPEFSGSQFRSSRDPECRFINIIAVQYRKPGLILLQQSLFLFYPQETHLCNLQALKIYYHGH